MNTQLPTPVWRGAHKAGLAILLLVQFAAAYVIGTGHLLTNDQSGVFAPIAITAFIPVALFLATYALSTRFRRFVLAQDLRTLTMMQHWRVIGFVFLPLYAFGVLPGLFAWPGGAGDVAVGLAAPFALFAQLRKSPGWQRKVFWLNIGGLADFAVAVVSGLSVSPTALGLLAGDVTTGIVLQLPLALIPIYAVPVFMIAHAISLLQLRRLSAAG